MFLCISPFHHAHCKEVWVLKSFGFHTLQLLQPKTANNEGFWAISSAQNKICIFCAYSHPNMLILMRYECQNHLDLSNCTCYSQKPPIMVFSRNDFRSELNFCVLRIPLSSCSFWKGVSVKIIWIWHSNC